MALSAPYQFLDRSGPVDYRFRVDRWELGELEILTRHSAAVKRIELLRLHVSAADLPGDRPYYDVGSRRLISQLLPLLPDLAGSGRTLRIRALGDPPATTYTLSVDAP